MRPIVSDPPKITLSPVVSFLSGLDGDFVAAGRDDDWWVGKYDRLSQVKSQKVVNAYTLPGDLLSLAVGDKGQVHPAPYLVTDKGLVEQPTLFNPPIQGVAPQNSRLQHAAWAMDGSLMAVLVQLVPGRGRFVNVQPPEKDFMLWLMAGPERSAPKRLWQSSGSRFGALLFHDKELILAGYDLHLMALDGTSRRLADKPPGYITDAVIAGDTLIATMERGSLGVWDIPGGKLRQTFGKREASWEAVALVPGQDVVLAGSNDGRLSAFHLPSGTLLGGVALPSGSAIKDIAVRLDGSLLIAAADHIWSSSIAFR